MNIEHIRQLLSWMADAQLTRLELTGPNNALHLYRNADRPPRPIPHTTAAPNNETCCVIDPSIGHFRRSHALRETPESEDGVFVSKGSLLGYLQIGLLYQPLYATQAGYVRAALCPDGQLVDYGTALFMLDV